jgi:8-oxo-dGTP diphosphatase
MNKAYGGVVINEQGLVLLREPRNHFGGYVWTFAKGRPDPGETAEETALREVKEETGVKPRIVAKIPGSFPGSTTDNEYFLMVPVEDTKKFEGETQSVRWVTQSEAEQLIVQTTEVAGKKRDLRLLQVAFEMFRLKPRGTD